MVTLNVASTKRYLSILCTPHQFDEFALLPSVSDDTWQFLSRKTGI